MTHWIDHAKQWSHIGSPLSPSQYDIQNLSCWLDEIFSIRQEPLSILLLGVTPEIVLMPWPKGTRLISVDQSLVMFTHVFPDGDPDFTPVKLSANWLQLPLMTSSIHVVIGDGCYSCLAKKEYALLSQEIQRVLRPDGYFLMRFFIKAEQDDSLSQIQDDFLKRRISTFTLLKLRLAKALQPSLEEGVCLHDVWQVWKDHFMNDAFTEQLGWSKKSINTIHHYKDVDTHYTFPTLKEIRAHLTPYFIEENLFIPSYESGENFPSLRLRLLERNTRAVAMSPGQS